MTTFLDHPTFICGHRKGGTTVLLCLFDNHPQMLTYPADSAFFYRVFPACESLDRGATMDILSQYTIRQNLTDEMAVVGDTELFDIEAIEAAYRKHAMAGEHTPKTHLLALMQAYAENCGQDPRRWKGWVEKTTSTEIYASQVAGWFPNSRFIHVVRDPRDNWGSLKSGWQARYQNQESSPSALLQSLLDRAGLGLRMALINQKALGEDRYRVVRFEDMTAAPQEHLSDLASFVGVDYDSALETPTVNGRLWRGNNFDGIKFSGLSATNVGRWKDRTEAEEIAVIEAHLGDIMRQLDYRPATSEREQSMAAADHYKWLNFEGRETARR